jgi:class 3 adenylate cyclase
VPVASEFLTFLFTDIEGSTALWEAHPAEMEGLLARHDEVLRAAVDGSGGRVVKSTGDGVHAVFRSPRDAVRAAVVGQGALADVDWGDGIDLRVRMGVHAGEVAERDGDWYGTEVNRAARVMSVAHGGQVVCTRIVEELVATTSTWSTSVSIGCAISRAPCTSSRSRCPAHLRSIHHCERSTRT